MTVPPFITKTWFWEQPTVSGNDNQIFITDFPNAPGSPDAQNVTPPLWIPSAPVLISYVRARCENATRTGQVEWQIDHGNRAYETGTPDAHQDGPFPGGWADNTNIQTLASINPGDPQEQWHFFDPPLVWDRTLVNGVPNDRLWCNTGESVADIVTLELGIIVPNIAAPQAPGNWQQSAGPAAMSADSASDAGYTMVVTIAPSAIAALGAATATAVALQSASNAPMNVGAVYIGPSAGGSNPCDAASLEAMLSCGSAAANIPAESMAFFTVNEDVPVTTGFIIKFFITSGAPRYAIAGATPGWQTYYAQGDTASVVAGTIYTEGTSSSAGVTEVLKLLS